MFHKSKSQCSQMTVNRHVIVLLCLRTQQDGDAVNKSVNVDGCFVGVVGSEHHVLGVRSNILFTSSSVWVLCLPCCVVCVLVAR